MDENDLPEYIPPRLPQTITRLTQELVNQACDIIQDVANGITYKGALSRSDMSAGEFMKVLMLSTELSREYELAKVSQAEILASEVIDIADCVGEESFRTKNRIDARKWTAAKYNSKLYGDKLEVDVTRKVDIGSALLEARKRAESLPHANLNNSQLTQPSKIITYSTLFGTDGESDDTPY